MTAMIKATYEDHMGDDLRVVNAARVSFGKRSEWEVAGYDTVIVPDGYETHPVLKLKAGDQNLIRFLARGCTSGEWEDALQDVLDAEFPINADAVLKWAKSMPTHWTPFGHTAITLIEEIPIFVARQRFKHTVGFVYNEISRRYVTEEPTFLEVDALRKAAENKKQGSSDEIFYDKEGAYLKSRLYGSVGLALDTYNLLLESGVCAEQARMVLPQSMMTTYWVTGNLYSFASAYKARSRPDAQKEIRDLAAEWDRIIRPLFPVSWSALVD